RRLSAAAVFYPPRRRRASWGEMKMGRAPGRYPPHEGRPKRGDDWARAIRATSGNRATLRSVVRVRDWSLTSLSLGHHPSKQRPRQPLEKVQQRRNRIARKELCDHQAHRSRPTAVPRFWGVAAFWALS